ncbi:MAG: HPr family phosphocarrier protein [Acholeplasmatales bacterium]|nr:HPr family phosphocarrier protein [Acholeplasmatales bacterium]
MVKKLFKITSESGLHARPATILVNVAVNYKSEIRLNALKKTIDFKSIMGVMSLGVYSGTTIEVIADGEDENEAIEGIKEKILELKLGKEI